MAFYRIADFLVEINSDEVLLIKERFKTDSSSAAAPDISVTITDDDFKVFGFYRIALGVVVLAASIVGFI